MKSLLSRVRKYLFHTHEKPEDRLYLDAELKRDAMKTNLVMAGTLSILAFPFPLLWGATHDFYTWRIYALSPIVIGLIFSQ